MALRFFRQRQKLVLIVMVLLMFAFALSSVIPSLIKGKGRAEAIGHIGETEVKASTARQALIVVNLLRGPPLGLGSFYLPRPGEVEFARFLALNKSDGDQGLAWTLLRHEAEGMGAGVSPMEVERVLNLSGLKDKRLEEAVANLGLRGFTRKHLDRAITDYLVIMQALTTASSAAPPTLPSLPQPPPSIPEMRSACRTLHEQIQLAVATFPADDFLEGVPEPTEEQVAQQFAKARHLLPGAPTNKTEFGFGYRQPDRARIAWLFVDTDSLRKAAQPTEEQMARFWETNRGKLTKWVDVAPATAPASQPASAPAVAPERKEVVLTDYADALPTIRRRLGPTVAEDLASRLLRRAQQLIKINAAAKDPHAETVRALIRPADAVLARPVAGMPEITATLMEVVDRVASVAGVKIVYPFGTHGKYTLDPGLKIKLPKTTRKPLGEILKQIQQQAKYLEIKWVECEGVPNAIFPVAPVNLAPVSSGQTELLTAGEIRSHDLLGRAWTDPNSGRPLGAELATAKEFQGPQPKTLPLIEVGQDYPRAMFVGGDRRGQLLWRLLQAAAEQDAESLTEKIAEQVVKDLKTKAAFAKAVAAAEAMRKKLPTGDLKDLAEAANAGHRETKMLSRRSVNPWVRDDFSITTGMMYAQFVARRLGDPGMPEQLARIRRNLVDTLNRLDQQLQFNPKAELFGPSFFINTEDPDLKASREDLLSANDKLTDQAFKLAPADFTRQPTDKPSAVVALPRLRRALLIQRIGYELPSEADFETKYVPELKQLLKVPDKHRAIREWFLLANIKARVGYKDRRPMPVAAAKDPAAE